MSPKTIGILAGMGPRSTAPFVDLVVTECQRQYGARHVEDFPHMLIYSLPAPFYADRPIDHERAEGVVQAGLQRLEGMGVDFIAMPCNTAHSYYPSLAASIKVPLLNIITEACATLQHYQRIAVCATETTVNSGLYQQGIAAAGKQPLPTGAIQPKVTELITGIIGGRDRAQMRALWNDIVGASVQQGAGALLVACTELNALGHLEDNRIAIVDATAALAQATVRKYLEGAPREEIKHNAASD
jgi:aspartate racemase